MSYVGRLLVAPPSQDDDFWSKSVVYIYEESSASTIGLVLNKTSERTVSELADHHDMEFDGEEQIYIGGPLNSAALVMLHTDDWACTNTMQVENGLRVSSDKTMLKRICKGDTPKKWRLLMGMSGWANDQLEDEIKGKPPYSKKKSWLVAPANKSIMFEKDPEKMWTRALELAVHEATESYFMVQ